MTREESIKVLAIFKATYPNSYRGMTKADAQAMASVWSMQFPDVPLDVMMIAVYKLIATCTFPPSVAEVHKTLQKMCQEAYYGEMYNHTTEEQKREMKRIRKALKRYDRLGETVTEPTLTDLLEGGILKLEGGDK